MRFLRLAQVSLSISLLSLGLNAGCSLSPGTMKPVLPGKDSPESKVGERLFREIRFSKHFVEVSQGDVNFTGTVAESQLASLGRARTRAPNPFAREATSCVTCHMVDDASRIPDAGSRAYTDFAAKSVIQNIGDGRTHTPRNSPTLVNAFISGRPGPFFLHYDGEFTTIEDLIIGGYTGRNFGWRPEEAAISRAQIVKVLKEDNGDGVLARKFGRVPYRTIFKEGFIDQSQKASIAEDLRLDMDLASDEQILSQAVQLIKMYLEALTFQKDADDEYMGSPYDVFLKKNRLPRKPQEGEAPMDYARRLVWQAAQLTSPKWVKNEADGEFETHDQDFVFGPTELEGMRIFFARSIVRRQGFPGFEQAGNCVACHTPPDFTDFTFHNSGATQDEYDSVHGNGTFLKLKIPTQAERLKNMERDLVPNAANPRGQGVFASAAQLDNLRATDLGAWNIFGHPGCPTPQASMKEAFCAEDPVCDPDTVLPHLIAVFKTPGIRDLGHTDPYLHTGAAPTIESVIEFYRRTSVLARAGTLRNPDPELMPIELNEKSIEPLSAFLRSLNEDYE